MFLLSAVLSILQLSVSTPSRQPRGLSDSINPAPRLTFTTEVVHGVTYGSARPLPFVDSVVIHSDAVVVYGYRGVPNVGDDLAARLTVLDSSLTIDISEEPGTEIGAMVVLFRYTAAIDGLETRRYLLALRDRDRRGRIWRQYSATLDLKRRMKSHARLQTDP